MMKMYFVCHDKAIMTDLSLRSVEMLGILSYLCVNVTRGLFPIITMLIHQKLIISPTELFWIILQKCLMCRCKMC